MYDWEWKRLKKKIVLYLEVLIVVGGSYAFIVFWNNVLDRDMGFILSALMLLICLLIAILLSVSILYLLRKTAKL